MNMKIEELKKELNRCIEAKEDWKPSYYGMMKELYESVLLFIGLSISQYDDATHTSVPLASAKDFGGQPAIYVFTDIEYATNWMRNYRNVSPDMKYGLIGAILKNEHDFMYVFNTARALDIKMIMLDEGGTWVGLDMDSFFSVNDISTTDMSMILTEEEMNNIVNNNEGSIPIKFARLAAIPLTSD